MLARASQLTMLHNGEPVKLRVGIHSGRLVSGMLGTRLPKFTLFGDTMNTASRMVSGAQEMRNTASHPVLRVPVADYHSCMCVSAVHALRVSAVHGLDYYSD